MVNYEDANLIRGIVNMYDKAQWARLLIAAYETGSELQM